MIRKLAVTAFAVSLFALNAMAQNYPANARVQSLGGSFIVDDASDVMRYSAYMNNYTDIAQITFDSPIWGVKSFGDKVNIGVVVNRPLLLDASFYTDASAAAKVVNAGISGITDQNIPHILFGLNLSSNFQLGFDLFWEHAHYGSSINDEPEGGTSSETKVTGNVNNAGGIVSGIIGLGDGKLALKAGMGLPRMRAKSEVTTANTVETEAKSEKGLFSVLGGELGFTTREMDVTIGADWTHSHFQFKGTDGTTGNQSYNNTLNFYAGANATVDSSSFVTFMYDFRIQNNGNHPDNTTHDARRVFTNVISSIFYAGYENVWTQAWIFDKFAARAGVNYVISSTVDHQKGDGTGGSYTSRIKHETDYSQVDPCLGIGFVKKIFALDVTVDPAVWAGLISGPKVGTVTATLDF